MVTIKSSPGCSITWLKGYTAQSRAQSEMLPTATLDVCLGIFHSSQCREIYVSQNTYINMHFHVQDLLWGGEAVYAGVCQQNRWKWKQVFVNMYNIKKRQFSIPLGRLFITRKNVFLHKAFHIISSYIVLLVQHFIHPLL